MSTKAWPINRELVPCPVERCFVQSNMNDSCPGQHPQLFGAAMTSLIGEHVKKLSGIQAKHRHPCLGNVYFLQVPCG